MLRNSKAQSPTPQIGHQVLFVLLQAGSIKQHWNRIGILVHLEKQAGFHLITRIAKFYLFFSDSKDRSDTTILAIAKK